MSRKTTFTQEEFKEEMARRETKPRIEYRVGSLGGQGYYVIADNPVEALNASDLRRDQIQEVIIWKIDGVMTPLSRAYQKMGDRAGREPLKDERECTHCRYTWGYKGNLLRATCPSCGKKTLAR